ncbi:transposase [Paenibacillus sp. FSL K6-1217]|uniref:transposase n=1 Tax=Paenibacillus sp. FSL K6-1217 TaxID=2921466 RepID=UPI00386CE3E3
MSAKSKLYEGKRKSGSCGEFGTLTEPESVFGQLKNNRGFRRFLLRGIEKVTLEVGWLSLAHNVLKQAANDQKRRAAILQ